MDLVLEIGPDVFPIEIKAGATITPDYFKGLKSFEKVVTTGGSGLIYGGSEKQTRGNTRIYPFHAIEEMLGSEVSGQRSEGSRQGGSGGQ